MRPELATGLRLPPRPADAGARQYAYHNQARYVRRWSADRGALPCPASPPGHNADKLVHYFPRAHGPHAPRSDNCRSEEHTSELQSLMRISYAVFCLKKKINNTNIDDYN